VAPPLEHQAAAAPENTAPPQAGQESGPPVEPERKKDYETVNQPPQQPRKGWWQRLVS
jgi:hypothetical protein